MPRAPTTARERIARAIAQDPILRNMRPAHVENPHMALTIPRHDVSMISVVFVQLVMLGGATTYGTRSQRPGGFLGNSSRRAEYPRERSRLADELSVKAAQLVTRSDVAAATNTRRAKRRAAPSVRVGALSPSRPAA